jgi:hypothetical protein
MAVPPGDEVPATAGPAAPSATTGDSRVDQAVSRLDELAGLPVTQHPAVFEYVHERLTEALGDTDGHGRPGTGTPGQQAGGADEPGSRGG